MLGTVAAMTLLSATLLGAGPGGGVVHAAPAAPDGRIGTWSALGSGFDRTVWSLALGAGDTLYAGGDFRTAGGAAAVGVARWDGSTWAQVGDGLDDSVSGSRLVSTLRLSDGSLYAVGNFTRSGSGLADDTGVAVFAGSGWTGVGGGVQPGENPGVLSLVLSDDTVYVGGNFNQAGALPADDSNVAALDSSGWNNLDGGVRLTTGPSVVRALALTSQGNLVAAGVFNQAGTGAADDTNIAQWDGSAWSSLDGGPGTPSDQVYSLAVGGDDSIYAGGNFAAADNGSVAARGIAQWNGTSWGPVGSGVGVSNGAVRTIVLDEDRGLIYAGGNFTRMDDDTVNRIAVWDAGIAEWLPLNEAGVIGVSGGTGIESLVVAGPDVYIGGAFTNAGPLSGVGNVAQWTWDAPEGVNSITSSPGLDIDIAGEGFIGVPATSGVFIGGVPSPSYTRDDTTRFSDVIIPSGVYGTVSIEVDAVGGRASVGTVTLPDRPAPPTPATAPRDVSAEPGDASALVSWAAPASSGSFPVTYYLATSSPGGRTCLTSSLSCTVAGLTNGTAYAFTAQALTGAGWSAASDPSEAVTPVAVPRPTITITGAREGKRITVSGTTTGMGMGAILRPWVRLAGQSAYAQGSAEVLVSMDGTFAWSRRAGREASVYMQTPDGSVRSNTVTIR